MTETIIVSREGQSTRVKWRYDEARTPLGRLCKTAPISKEQKEQVVSLQDQVNPQTLQQDICEQIDCIFRLPRAKLGMTGDVYHPVSHPIQMVKGEGAPVTFSYGLARAVKVWSSSIRPRVNDG